MRSRFGPIVLSLLLCVGCYEPGIQGLLDPDEKCEFSTQGEVRDTGVLDVGPIPQLVNAYDGVMLVEARADKDVTSASVAFSSGGNRLPNVFVDGEEFEFPSVEGERHSSVSATTGSDGLAAAPFTLVTEREAVALQQLVGAGTDLDLRIELRAVVGGRDTTYPAFVDLQVCKQCLVGVGADVEGDAFVCPGGEPVQAVEPAPCRRGQDEVFSRCPP